MTNPPTCNRFKRIADIAGADDWYDAWGTAMSLHFDIAAVLDASDIDGSVTPWPFARWEYQRPPFTVPSIESMISGADLYSYGEVELAKAYFNGEITQADLIHAGDVLERYERTLRAAGKDY